VPGGLGGGYAWAARDGEEGRICGGWWKGFGGGRRPGAATSALRGRHDGRGLAACLYHGTLSRMDFDDTHIQS